MHLNHYLESPTPSHSISCFLLKNSLLPLPLFFFSSFTSSVIQIPTSKSLFALGFLSLRKLSGKKPLSFKDPSRKLPPLSSVMGDHLALLVDRLLTESTLEATIESRKKAQNMPGSDFSVVPIAEFTPKRKVGKLVECRICQEEDEASKMEIPCSCCGSLKYAHRKCVQRWCNEKGDTTCEICLQQFKPGYTAPPQLFHYGGIPMNFRGSWEISSRDLDDSQIITMVPSDRGFIESNYDYYSASTTRSAICCRSVAIIFMTLLVLRHSLPLMIGEAEQYSITLFSLLVLRTVGILIPFAVMVKVLSIYHRRRQQQVARDIPISGSDEESLSSHSIYQPQPHLIHVRQ